MHFLENICFLKILVKNCLFIFERKSCKNGFTKNILLWKWLNVLLQVKILCNVKAKKSLLLTFLVSKSLATGFVLQNYCICMSGSLFDDKFSHLKAFFRMVQNTTTRGCYSKFELNMKWKDLLYPKTYSFKRSFFLLKLCFGFW